MMAFGIFPRVFSISWRFVFSFLCFTFFVGSIPAADPPASGRKEAVSPDKRFEIRVVNDVEYRDLHEGEDPKKGKNKLDLYLPKNHKDFPILFFVHGGAWRHGDKSFLGVYATLARFYAGQGIGV